jgi:hypothetical protein
MAHVMMDLETLGKKPGKIVLSIGAAVFNPDAEFVDGMNSNTTFYRNINVMSSFLAGLTFDEETLKWWLKQPFPAQQALIPNPHPLQDVIQDFNAWFKVNDGVEIWAQGPSFDVTIWEAACAAVDLDVPWEFSNVRDCRTAYFFGNIDHHNPPIGRVGIYHNALDDSIFQARLVQLAFKNCWPKIEAPAPITDNQATG